MLTAIQTELPKREGQNSNFVEYVPNFCAENAHLDDVLTECESMQLSSKRTKAETQWLSSSMEPYVYPDSSPVHKAKDITKFPAINKLLSLVNESTEVTGPLDSCLVTKYNSKQASLKLHADDEDTIDQGKSICSFSLGCERNIEFWEQGRKPKKVKDIRMAHNSMVIMRPGAQQNLKHCVRAEPCSTSKDVAETQVRYSLSFRAVTKAPIATHAPPQVSTTDQASINTGGFTGSSTPPNLATVVRKPVCLIAGDSFAARMKVDKLEKNKLEVVNIAEGGSKISKVQKQLEAYAADNTGTKVWKIIVSVGTNDIRNSRNIDRLRGPLKQLCGKIQSLFPTARVYFQSLLPLPLKDSKDWLTNSTVQSFNRIIYNECIYRRFHYIEAFYPFTKFNRRWNEPYARFDKLFEVGGIHPNPEKGMGVLARYYIRALHSKLFIPSVFQ